MPVLHLCPFRFRRRRFSRRVRPDNSRDQFSSTPLTIRSALFPCPHPGQSIGRVPLSKTDALSFESGRATTGYADPFSRLSKRGRTPFRPDAGTKQAPVVQASTPLPSTRFRKCSSYPPRHRSCRLPGGAHRDPLPGIPTGTRPSHPTRPSSRNPSPHGLA